MNDTERLDWIDKYQPNIYRVSGVWYKTDSLEEFYPKYRVSLNHTMGSPRETIREAIDEMVEIMQEKLQNENE